MIPQFTQSGVLPPFDPSVGPTSRHGVSPYRISLTDFVEHFDTSIERRDILLGFLNYRKSLKAFGVVQGYQWIDGSFVENIEATANRPPNDIDVVTFAYRPQHLNDDQAWNLEAGQRTDLFAPQESKQIFKCDAYFVDLSIRPEYLVSTTAYWFGLFSHRRETGIWKGMIQINLSDSEDQALELLDSRKV